MRIHRNIDLMSLRLMVLAAAFISGCGGTPGSCGTCSLPMVCQANSTCAMPNAAFFFQDTVQTTGYPWGFTDGSIDTEAPIDHDVVPNDANGSNLTVVANPLGGGGSAIRHFLNYDVAGSGRSQIGIWFNDTVNNAAWHAAASSGNEIYIAQEIYLPVAIRGTGQYPWTDICGIQVTDNDGNNRWQTNPGFHIATGWYGAPGDNYLVVEWGSQADVNESAMSSIPLPVGEWFDVEIQLAMGNCQ